jgi:transposase InsO family protein
VDDYSKYTWVYLLKQKDAASIATIFSEWISFAQNECGYNVKALRTDGGGEYQKELGSILLSRGIQHQTTTPYTPQSNGVAERMNRSLNEAVRAMMFQANMPQPWWGEAILHAVYL